MRRFACLFTALVLAGTALGACGSDVVTGPAGTVPGTAAGPVPGTAGPATVAPRDLDGRTFLSSSVTEHGAPRPLVPGTRLQVGFRDGKISAGAGCNSMGGDYRLTGAVLHVEDLMTTDMACATDRMQQDTWLSSVLRANPTVTLDGAHLTIASSDTRIELLDVKVADPDRPLVGTTWMLDSLLDGQAATSGPLGAARPTLSFAAGGIVRFTDACQRGSGRYAIAGNTITFTSVIPDPDPSLPCPSDQAAVDEAIRRLLDGEVTMTIDGPILKLMQGDHGIWWRAGETTTTTT